METAVFVDGCGLIYIYYVYTYVSMDRFGPTGLVQVQAEVCIPRKKRTFAPRPGKVGDFFGSFFYK